MAVTHVAVTDMAATDMVVTGMAATYVALPMWRYLVTMWRYLDLEMLPYGSQACDLATVSH